MPSPCDIRLAASRSPAVRIAFLATTSSFDLRQGAHIRTRQIVRSHALSPMGELGVPLDDGPESHGVSQLSEREERDRVRRGAGGARAPSPRRS